MNLSPKQSYVSAWAPPRPSLRAVPGQFFLAIPPTRDPYLPRPVWPFQVREQVATSILLPVEAAAWERAGQLEVRGPYGRGFSLPERPRRVLVLAEDPPASGQLLPLIEVLVARECEVTVFGESSNWIERWLPPEVEYHGADKGVLLSDELWSWADQFYACGSFEFYDAVCTQAHAARLKLEKGWGQILSRDVPLVCGIGVCYLCAVRSVHGLVLTCQEGPVMDLADWIREG